MIKIVSLKQLSCSSSLFHNVLQVWEHHIRSLFGFGLEERDVSVLCEDRIVLLRQKLTVEGHYLPFMNDVVILLTFLCICIGQGPKLEVKLIVQICRRYLM